MKTVDVWIPHNNARQSFRAAFVRFMWGLPKNCRGHRVFLRDLCQYVKVHLLFPGGTFSIYPYKSVFTEQEPRSYFPLMKDCLFVAVLRPYCPE